MSKIPFEKFIITLLFCGKTINEIIDKLHNFNYEVNEEEVLEIFNDTKSILPPNIINLLDNRILLQTTDEIHTQWLNHFGVFEILDYIVNKNQKRENPPKYFKWCEDCVWVHTYQDVMSLINIFLFNEESLESISDIIIVKYKKKIGIETLKLYEKIFWNINGLSAKECLKYCIPFRSNSLIIRQFKTGDSELEIEMGNNASDDGCDVPFNFHDNEYIKWKIGYKVKAPEPKHFLEKIQTDSMYKYYEIMNMVQSIDTEEEEGLNDLGSFNKTTTKKRNVEEMRVKIAKQWFDLYIKAKDHMPDDRSNVDDFFKKMRELELDFNECDEQIAKIEDMPDVLDDISQDMQQL